MSGKARNFRVPALEKGLQILETLSAAAEPMSLTEICNTMGRGPSELYRMIGYLEDRCYIVREPHSGNYHLSLKIYEVAHLSSFVNKMIRAATIPMRELALEVRESCHLSVLHEDELLVLYQQESPEKFRFSVEVGARFDVLHTASGRLLIAHLPPQERSALLEGHPGYREMNVDNQKRTLDRLDDIVRNGFSYAEQETSMGIRDTAVLVGNPAGGLCAALAIPSLIISRKQANEVTLLAALHDCGRKISASLSDGVGTAK